MTLPSTPSVAAPFVAHALTAALTVSDLPRSVAWYRDVVGFSVAREYAPEGRLIAVALSAGPVELLLTQDNGAQGSDRVKGQGFSLQFTTGNSLDDIDALASGITARGGALDDEPQTRFGARVFRLRDPDGFRLVFSFPRQR